MSERWEGKTHAVRLNFEGGLGSIVNLLHPDDGCSDLSEDGECVLTDWVENVQDDLLQGEIVLPVRVEWITEDEPTLHLLQPSSNEERYREAIEFELPLLRVIEEHTEGEIKKQVRETFDRLQGALREETPDA